VPVEVDNDRVKLGSWWTRAAWIASRKPCVGEEAMRDDGSDVVSATIYLIDPCETEGRCAESVSAA
jgi:hypothetical protein